MALSGTQIVTRSGNVNFFPGKVGIGIIPSEKLTIGGNISATGGIHTVEGISTESYVFSPNYLGVWKGDPLSGNQVNIEGTDLKSTNIRENLFLKSTGDGRVIFDSIDSNEVNLTTQNIDGNLTVRGDIIEFASDNIIFSKTSVFTKSLVTGLNVLNTFDLTAFNTAKYIITLTDSVKRTALEVLVTHNGTNAEGTTYGIVDAQSTSLLSDITSSLGDSTIDLNITVTSNCEVIVHGVAHY
tara:strand:- start:551 stop:1273 length:723 start_codon:yes stop_codon:yes gene_type:complete